MVMNFNLLVSTTLHTKIIENGSVVSEKSKFNFHRDQEMNLTFNTPISSLTQSVSGHRLQYFLKNSLFSLFPTEKPKL